MIFTERDRRIVFDLQSYGIFTTRRIQARHFPGVHLTTVLRRLRALERLKYIQRISGLAEGKIGWAVTRQSTEKLQFSSSKVHFPKAILEHDTKLTDLRLRLEGAGLVCSWTPEHEIRARLARKHGLRLLAQRNIPDGLMGVEINGCQEMIAVELELSAKNQARYQRIFDDYREKKSIWGFWYIVDRPTIGRQIEKAAESHYLFGNRPRFLWSVLGDVMTHPLSAVTRCRKERFGVAELFTPRAASRFDDPAHAAAQGVSGQAHEAENMSA